MVGSAPALSTISRNVTGRRLSSCDVTGRPPAFKVIEPNVLTCSSIALAMAVIKNT